MKFTFIAEHCSDLPMRHKLGWRSHGPRALDDPERDGLVRRFRHLGHQGCTDVRSPTQDDVLKCAQSWIVIPRATRLG
jgi:hypothetical protein